MSSPGQKRGTCGHVMAVFDGHLRCARCRDKGVGDDPCVLKKACPICKAFTPEQIQQLSIPTYRDRKNRDKKTVSASPTPTLVDPSQVSVLGWVDREKAVDKSETPAGKKKRTDDSPKPSSKKNSSSKPRSDELKDLDDQVDRTFCQAGGHVAVQDVCCSCGACEETPSVITSDSPFWILEPPPVACPLV